MTDRTGQPTSRDRLLRRALRWSIYGISLVLLVACIAVAVHGTKWSKLEDASIAPFLGLAGVIAFSLIINAFLFQMATRPFEHPGKHIGVWDWQAMMTATALVNYLPKAGLVGRTALLKYRWGIRYRATIFTLAVISTATVLIMAFILALTVWRHGIDGVWVAIIAASLPLSALIAIPFVSISFHRFGGHIHQRTLGLWILLWLALRFLDTLCYIARLYLAALVLGIPLSLEKAAVLAIAAMFVTMASPIPNGIGIREWLYAFLAKFSFGGHALHSWSAGLDIAVVDRAAEALVFVVLGLIGVAYLHRHGMSLTAHADPDHPLQSLETDPAAEPAQTPP